MRLRAISLRAAFSRAAAAALLVVAAGAPGLAGAVEFTEVGDAGQAPLTAQNTGNTGAALTSIFGSIFSDADADLFVINIANPLTFSATTVGTLTDSLFDTHLYLFSAEGAPVYTNDDASGLSFQSTLPAGAAFGPVVAGRYLIGIAQSGVDAVNAVNQLLFATGLTTDLRGAAFGLQPALLAGFTGSGFDVSGSYEIRLTGAAVAVTPVPEPALWLMLAVGAAGIPVLNRRRRALRAEARLAS